MPVKFESEVPTKLRPADLIPRGPVHPSPADWRDQIIYFLLPDRFSDYREHQRPQFDRRNPEQFRATNKRAWMEAGKVFQGGTLRGIRSKLNYLHELGVTALWIGPVWRQRKDLQTYHGYGIQNFLDVDPRFGTRQDLRDLVDAAHDHGMYVLLDVIYNHTGNNWFYDINGKPQEIAAYHFQPPYPFHSWRSAKGESGMRREELRRDDGVWPREFQNPHWYIRAGKIGRWDAESWENPFHPDNEFRRGDIFDLKKLNLRQDHVLSALVRVYQYWIALSDCDGFRIDSVKHVPLEASRNFCSAIHEFAESIGKLNFLLLGEVAGGEQMARAYVEIFGLDLDAVLDIGAPASHIAMMVKGLEDPGAFFNQFQESNVLGLYRATGRYHASMFDDHDMIGRGKHRFSAHNTCDAKCEQAAHAVGVQLTTLGIPCIYYGTEQAFDGTEDRHDWNLEPAGNHGKPFDDRYIRESMFGGSFGAFETEGCHFFDTDHPTFLRMAAIARVRNRGGHIGLALRRGRQYRRQTAVSGPPFSFPGSGQLVAWSRIYRQQEVLVALNTNGTQPRKAEVTVDASLNPQGSSMTVLYRSDWSDAELRNPPQNLAVAVNRHPAGRATVRIDLPAAGMAILTGPSIY